MIDSVNVPVQAVNANASVVFINDRIKTGCTVRHEAGSSRFTIAKPGIYKVTYSSIVTAADAGTAILNIVQDGEAIPGAQIQAGVGATDIEAVSVTTLVRVCHQCSCSNISVVNDSTIPLTISNANIVIDRLC